jgi:hypothetical protein
MVQGPQALPLVEELNGGPPPKYFRIGEMTIAGRRVFFLRHGMAGVPGAELFGPVGKSRGGAPGDSRGGAEVQLAAGRLQGLYHQRDRRGRMDSLAGAGDLYQSGTPGLPRVAASDEVRKRSARSAAASIHRISRAPILPLGISGTATSSSSIMTSSGVQRWSGWRTSPIASKSRPSKTVRM